MTAQAALKMALRDVLGPDARLHGYKGSAPTWRKSNSYGDWVVVNVQSSSWNTSEEVRCVVNISAAPEPWLRWQGYGLGWSVPKSVTESLGLYRDRLHPTGTPVGADGWWEITGQRSAMAAVTDMVKQLEESGWGILDQLLRRDGMLDQIRRGDLGDFRREHHAVYFARAEALLLMDLGPSAALDACLTSALEGGMPEQRERAEQFDNWVRDQARMSIT